MIKQSIKTALMVVLVACSFNAYAQTSKEIIKGTVTDAATKEAVIGGAVQVKNTSRGVVTDLDGNYEIAASEGETLVFSSLSYKPQEIRVGKSNVINVALETDAEGLEEVVFIGYGTAKKRDLTGSVSSIKAENFEYAAPKNTQDMLRGSTAGVNVGSSASAKGDADLLIRGESSLTASSSPLLVVDGVIYDGALTDINPYDIESIDILKDASSAAIYGAKAANGVIAVFTKKAAKKNRPTVDFNANIGVSTPAHMPDVVDGEGFIKFRQDYCIGKNTDEYLAKFPEIFTDPHKLTSVDALTWYNYDQATPLTSMPSDEQLTRSWLARLYFSNPEQDQYIAGKETDWAKHTFHNALQQDYTVALSNKKEESSYYWSFGYTDREGILIGDRYKNYRTRLNLETTVAKFLTLGMNTNFAIRDEGFLTAASDDIWELSPYAGYYLDDPDASDSLKKYPMDNPTAALDLFDIPYQAIEKMYYNLSSNLYAKVKLPFNIEYQFNYTPHLQFYNYFYHKSMKHFEWAPVGGSAERTHDITYNWQIDNILRWKHEWGNHTIEATALYNSEQGNYWSTTSTTTNFSPNDILSYHRMQAGTVPAASSNDTYYTGDALMARMFYSFGNKYMVTASVRRDGYSAFGANNKRATFPAVALGWVFTNEKFMENAVDGWLNYGKLRLSYGINGNRSIGQYASISDMTSGPHPYINSNGIIYKTSQLYVNQMSNPNLKWERQAAWNVGLDFSLFNNILSGSIEGYIAETADLLVSRKLPDITGFSSVYSNLGQLNNSGLEITLKAKIINNENFRWDATGTFSMNRRKLISLYGDMEDILDASGKVIGQKEQDDITNGWFIGHDPDAIWTYRWNGTWKTDEAAEAAKYGCQPGDFKYVDINGDGVMTNDDKQFIGYTTPRSRWTLATDATICKNWTVSASFYSYWGQMGTFNQAANVSNFPDRTSSYDQPRWMPDNQIDEYARIGSKNIGSKYVEKSFIRMDNLSVAYNLPKSVCEKVHVQNARVSASIRNVFCWSPMFNYWYDPENGGYYPRTFNLGVHFAL